MVEVSGRHDKSHGEGGFIRKKAKRDIEKGYTTKQMAAKLRRFADCLEQGKQFQIRIAGERILVPADATLNIEHERGKTMEKVEFQYK